MSQRRKRFIALKREEFDEVVGSIKKLSAAFRVLLLVSTVNFLGIVLLIALNFLT